MNRIRLSPGSVCGFFTALALLAAPRARAVEAATPLPADHAERMAKGLKLFQSDVRGLLVENCLKCHGGEKTKGELDLNTREALLKGGAEGPSVVIGKAKESRLYKLIAQSEKPFMPSKGDKLPEAAIQKIADWIDLGAPYDKPLIEGAKVAQEKTAVTETERQFWSFKPLAQVAPPKVKNESWPRTDIDRFILARLESQNLAPNGPADRRILIRRAYLDLAGIPPTPAEIDAFLADPAPDAFGKVVDHLLASPHYGERWGRHWLDVSRFAESHGFEQDYDRPHAYHFRDFVIKALNQDLPYDKFVKWQLAGDEFEPDNPLALMATGFLGAGVFPTQITANEVERTRYDALDDMASTMGTAMLGMTVGCARCHDHKYDPIPNRDYYRLVSTFSTTVRSEIDMDLNPAAFPKEKAAYDREHAPLVASLKKYETEEMPGAFEKWLLAGPVAKQPDWMVFDFAETKSAGGATIARQADGSYLISGKNPDFDTQTFVARTSSRKLTAFKLEALHDPSMPKGGPGRAENGNFALGKIRVFAASLAGTNQPVELKLKNPRATFEQNKEGLSVASSLDDNKQSGWAIDPQFGKDHAAIFEFGSDPTFEGGAQLTFVLEYTVNNRHSIGRPRLSYTQLSAPGFDGSAVPQNVVELMAATKTPEAIAKLTPAQRQTLQQWHQTSDSQWLALNKKVQDHSKLEPKPKLTKVMVCSEGFTPIRNHTQGADFFKDTYFLNRGNTDQKKGLASPGFLQVLMRSPDQEKRWQAEPPKGWRTSYRRTALANWMTDTELGAGHLLARVIVNRLWQHHMGQGIVATPNDFGAQGQPPSHPELLDWLASQLVKNGWSLKQMHKLMMTSAVYMQAGAVSPVLQKADPNNTLFGRHTPKRLEAETIRDSLLAVSNTLDPKMYGPGSLSQEQDRRSIYFMIKRSQLIPMMQLFDAPEPHSSVGARPDTTIAPQALLFMNNKNLRRYASNLAKTISEKAADPDAVVLAAYRRVLGRPPSAEELADSLQFLAEQKASYLTENKDPGTATADLCQALFSLNEFIYVE